MIRLALHPLLWALLAALVVFFPTETMEYVGLLDTRPGKWVSP